jgi:hypothetical protein
MPATYSVIVGNTGTVYDGASIKEARATFQHYADQSRAGTGRASGERVTLTSSDGTPIKEYAPPRGKVPTIVALSALVRAIKRTIHDDDRADEYDTIPGISLTVGWSDVSGDWSYQTGDNSYTGGAYGYPHWGVVSVCRRSDSRELARDIRNQLEDLAAQ